MGKRKRVIKLVPSTVDFFADAKVAPAVVVGEKFNERTKRPERSLPMQLQATTPAVVITKPEKVRRIVAERRAFNKKKPKNYRDKSRWIILRSDVVSSLASLVKSNEPGTINAARIALKAYDRQHFGSSTLVPALAKKYKKYGKTPEWEKSR